MLFLKANHSLLCIAAADYKMTFLNTRKRKIALYYRRKHRDEAINRGNSNYLLKPAWKKMNDPMFYPMDHFVSAFMSSKCKVHTVYVCSPPMQSVYVHAYTYTPILSCCPTYFLLDFLLISPVVKRR